MKKLILSTVLLWTAILMLTPTLDAQMIDTLHILNQNKVYAQVVAPDIEVQKKLATWRRLMDNFKGNLEDIKEQVPEYLIYNITYRNQQTLQIEEVDDVVKYEWNNEEMTMASRQSVAHLIQKDLHIHLYFNTIEDLINTDYSAMIEKGMQNITKKSSILKRAYFPQDNYFYSFSGAEMLKNSLSKSKPEWIVVATPYLGILRNTPLLELNTGMGVLRKGKKWTNLYAFINLSYQYDAELKEHNINEMIGIAFSKQDLGIISIAFPIGESTIYEDVLFRYSGGTFAYKNISVNLQLYVTKNEGVFPGLSVGIGW